MIEMMIVMAIIMIISAMALPNILNSVQIMRMRSSLTEITGLYQQTRRQAVRDTKIYPVLTTTINGRLTFYADISNSGSYQTGEPAVVMPQGVSIIATPGTTTGIDTTNVTGTLPGFNNRGLPCTYVSQYLCNFVSGGNPSKFVVYLQTTNGGIMAVSVSPAGNVKGYIWNGATFQ